MMKKTFKPFATLIAASALALLSGCASTGENTAAEEVAVKITPAMATAEVMHNGQKTAIMRNQDQKNTVAEDFAKTSRKCPPFCIQPASLHPEVETIAEVEVIDYLTRMANGDSSILVVDSRTPNWVEKGSIPGAINIPWTKLREDSDPFAKADILTGHFGAKEKSQGFDFSGAKTVVMFCNGMWCGQSPNNIKSLLKMGYPPQKIKWYRGGMQSWNNLGLTTTK